MPPAYDDCVKHACCVDGLLIMLRHFLVPPLVRWQMLWRMRRRWLTWGLLGAALPPWTNNVAHPKVSWWGRLLGPLAMRRWAFSTQAWHCLKLEFVTPSSLNPCIFFLFIYFLFLGSWYEQLWRFPKLRSPSGNQDLSLGTQALLSCAATDGPELNRTQSSPPSSPFLTWTDRWPYKSSFLRMSSFSVYLSWSAFADSSV